MRIVTYGAACTLDGFIAGSEGEIDWLHFSKDVQQIMRDYWKTIDTILYGRKTWDQAARMGGGGGGAGGSSTMRSYVFSRTLPSIDAKGVELVRDNAGEFVRQIKTAKGKGICVMGGGEFARSLFEADLIDEVRINVHPVLLGSGVPLFLDPGRRVTLELVSSRTIDGGCVCSNYRVKHEH
jgi:dihydrofolate reductase